MLPDSLPVRQGSQAGSQPFCRRGAGSGREAPSEASGERLRGIQALVRATLQGQGCDPAEGLPGASEGISPNRPNLWAEVGFQPCTDE